MGLLRKACNLSGTERLILMRAIIYLAAMRIGLWLLPPRVLLGRRTASDVDTQQVDRRVTPKQIAWSVRVVSRYLPGTRSCLVQALATQVMLARRGHTADLRIGVAKDEAGRFKAHAWVECAGAVIIGGDGLSRYTPLPPLQAWPKSRRTSQAQQ